MHLKNQIAYEFGALQLLKTSGRTPIPVFLDNSKQFFTWNFGDGIYRRASAFL